MTIRVEPTNGSGIDRQISSRRIAAATRYAGSDWVVPDTRDINATRDGALAAGPLGGFDRIDGDNTNQSVQFDTGEAFVGGAYLASDDTTAAEHTVGPLSDNATTTIYLGWDLSTADTLIIGPAGDFGTDDPKIELWEVTTDGSSITGDQDLRTTAPSNERGEVILDITDTDDTTELSVDTGTIASPYPQYEIWIEREKSGSEDYMNLRVNGVSSGDYFYDYYDALNDVGDSQDNQSSFGKLAGVDQDGGGKPTVCQQRVIVGVPQNIPRVTTDYDPMIWTRDEGVGKNIDYVLEGHLNVEQTIIDRIEVFNGTNSAGRIQIRGLDPFK